MIDNMSVKLPFTNKEWSKFISQFPAAIVNGSTMSKLYFNWANLRIEFYPNSEQLWIKNSWHKFYNAVVRDIPIGIENYNDFTRSDFNSTVNFFSKVLNKTPDEFEVFGLFEYGVNISVVPHIPMHIIDSYISYGNWLKKFRPVFPRTGKVKGRSAYLTEYKVKFYDKSSESKCINRYLLRYEICNNGVGRLKQLLSKNKVTLEDLMKKETFSVLSRDLLKTYFGIKKLPLHTKNISRETMLEVIAYSEPAMYRYDKATLSKWKLDKNRKSTKAQIEDLENVPESIHRLVLKNLKKKIGILIK